MSKIIALDVDGILANFYLGLCNKYNLDYKLVDKWDSKEVMEKMKLIEEDFIFWATLPSLNKPEEIGFDFDYYLTSMPNNSAAISGRKLWLSFSSYPDKPVIVSNNKLQKCNDLGIDLLVDDKPKTVREFLKAKKDNQTKTDIIQYIPHYFADNLIVKEAINVRFLNEIKKYL